MITPMNLNLYLENPVDIRHFTAGLDTNSRALCHLCACLVTVGNGSYNKNCSSKFVSAEEIIKVPYLPESDKACTGFVRSGNS